MAWYGNRRSGQPRVGARAVVVGLGIAMIGVLAIQTSSAVRSGIEESRRSMDGTTASMAGFASGIAGWTFGFGRSAEDEARIVELETQIRDLHRWKDLAETMALRMERYEKLLDLVGETQGQAVTARVVAEENGPFAASKIANAGAANGVREGYSAINEYGLVGRVVRVGEYTSRILMLTDFSSRIPVMGTQSGDRALLVGDNGTGARLIEPETPDKIVEGEVWVTSGDDGKMPLGVRVGVARKVGDEWRLDLAIQTAAVDFVRLVPPPDFASPDAVPPLGGVQENTDSTLRTVSATPTTPITPPAAAPAAAAARPPVVTAPAATPAPSPATTPATTPATPATGQGGLQ
jgi:rod shape-determining protein MreC